MAANEHMVAQRQITERIEI